jgi:hypothetical protein
VRGTAVTAAGILVHNATPEDCARYQELLAKGIDALNQAERAEFDRLVVELVDESLTKLVIDPTGDWARIRLTPRHFMASYIDEDPTFSRLWQQAHETLLAGNNVYSRAATMNNPTMQELNAAFKYISETFNNLVEAETGRRLASTHHWNYFRRMYPEQVLDSRNLVPTYSRSIHDAMHWATQSWESVDTFSIQVYLNSPEWAWPYLRPILVQHIRSVQ